MMENMKYKVGDKVQIKSLDWYNKNKDENGNVHCGDKVFDNYMSVFCGSVVTIGGIFPYNAYDIREDVHCRAWTDEMIESLVEEETKPEPKFKVGDRIYSKYYKPSNDLEIIEVIRGDGHYGYRIKNHQINNTYFMWECEISNYKLVEEEIKSEDELLDEYEELTDRAFKGGYEKCKSDIELNGFQLPEGYIFKDDNGNVINTTKIVLEKKKKEYPKSYEECCKVLNTYCGSVCGYNWKLLLSFQQLLICRDAYWKIAGEEMGLGKPWEPTMETVYCISRNDNVMKCSYRGGKSNILEFPTPEMRDAFKENFDPDIEICKEFL